MNWEVIFYQHMTKISSAWMVSGYFDRGFHFGVWLSMDRMCDWSGCYVRQQVLEVEIQKGAFV